MIKLKSILSDHFDLFELVFGNSEVSIDSVRAPEESTPHSLCFLSQKPHQELLSDLNASVWILTQDFWNQSKDRLLERANQTSASLVVCRNLQIAMAKILAYFDRRNELFAFPCGISPQTWIHPSAKISSNVTIGPFCSIGPEVFIDENTHIGPHCVIEGESKIGSNCYLESHVFIGRQTEIGHHCRIKPFASIGVDGFGYAPTPQGTLKIPQIGKVVIEDHVDIGSSVCIDRATLSHTRIGHGTKLDNLVHIAHNCNIGRYCFLTAGFAIAGSSSIGDYFMTGGTTAVGDHVQITDKVTLAGASVVTGNIDKSGSYGGNPIQPMQDYLRTRSSLISLTTMRRNLQKIMKHLNLDDE